MEQKELYRIIIANDMGNPVNYAQVTTVKGFLCPSRRNANVGPLDDYGSALHVDMWLGNGYLSIMGASDTIDPTTLDKPVTIDLVLSADGLSNTLLLTHKGIMPVNYAGGGFNDRGYAAVGNPNTPQTADPWEHKRFPFVMFEDTNNPQTNPLNGQPIYSYSVLGSSHPGSMPSLYGDGSVRSMPYTIDVATLSYVWSWNDGQQIRNPQALGN
jgi:hypothetical protein